MFGGDEIVGTGADAIRTVGAFLVAFAVTILLTPAARRLAVRTAFFDHPVDYKEHLRPTPYLGGLAVMAGILAGSLIFEAASDYKRMLAAALVICAVGTLDDRIQLGVLLRGIAQVATAIALWAVDLGWTMLHNPTADLALTIVWVVGITNAFNLMDNQDGAAGTVGAVSSAGIGALALTIGGPIAVPLAVIAFSVAGACLGFLPHNLSKPAKIFLGDGGSMPIGLLVACMVMAIPDGRLDWTLLFAVAPLAGLPILDTTLVVASRLRRGAPVLSGGRDHLTHRLYGMVGSERRVAVILALAQAALCGLSIALFYTDQRTVVAVTAAYLVVGAAIILTLEAPAAISPRPEQRPS